MTELESIYLCLDNLESASKLLERGVISSGECETIIYVSKIVAGHHDSPVCEKVKESS